MGPGSGRDSSGGVSGGVFHGVSGLHREVRRRYTKESKGDDECVNTRSGMLSGVSVPVSLRRKCNRC